MWNLILVSKRNALDTNIVEHPTSEKTNHVKYTDPGTMFPPISASVPQPPPWENQMPQLQDGHGVTSSRPTWFEDETAAKTAPEPCILKEDVLPLSDQPAS